MLRNENVQVQKQESSILDILQGSEKVLFLGCMSPPPGRLYPRGRVHATLESNFCRTLYRNQNHFEQLCRFRGSPVRRRGIFQQHTEDWRWVSNFGRARVKNMIDSTRHFCCTHLFLTLCSDYFTKSVITLLDLTATPFENNFELGKSDNTDRCSWRCNAGLSHFKFIWPSLYVTHLSQAAQMIAHSGMCRIR